MEMQLEIQWDASNTYNCELITPALDVCEYVRNIRALFIFSLFNKTLMIVSNVS